jgi:hypothetical protein
MCDAPPIVLPAGHHHGEVAAAASTRSAGPAQTMQHTAMEVTSDGAYGGGEGSPGPGPDDGLSWAMIGRDGRGGGPPPPPMSQQPLSSCAASLPPPPLPPLPSSPSPLPHKGVEASWAQRSAMFELGRALDSSQRMRSGAASSEVVEQLKALAATYITVQQPPPPPHTSLLLRRPALTLNRGSCGPQGGRRAALAAARKATSGHPSSTLPSFEIEPAAGLRPRPLPLSATAMAADDDGGSGGDLDPGRRPGTAATADALTALVTRMRIGGEVRSGSSSSSSSSLGRPPTGAAPRPARQRRNSARAIQPAT